MKHLVDVLVIVYNRPKYTAATLQILLEKASCYRLWIWQNGSIHAVSSIVSEIENHPSIARIYRSKENVGLREPTNWMWAESQAPLLAKVDDDCLMPTGWCERLVEIHQGVALAGILGCWPFCDEDIRPKLVERKTQTFNGHKIMVNPWVGGSGYLMKRECMERCGSLRKNEGFTNYCMRVAKTGWINGWPLPMITMDHMDDPRSMHTVFKSDADVLEHRGITAARRGISTLEQLRSRVQAAALELQTCSPDWKDYIGWRVKARRLLKGFRR